MSGERLPDQDHVMHYCKPSTVVDNYPEFRAFMPTPTNPEPSFNWVEYLNPRGLEGAIEKVRAVVKERITVRHIGRFVALNVGDVRTEVKESEGVCIWFEHTPDQPKGHYPSHADIRGAAVNKVVAEAIHRQILCVYLGL